MKLNKVLISGGAGFIGSNLALALVKKGYQVRVLDNLSPQVHGNNARETSPLYQSIFDKVDFIKGTVTSRKDWREALEGQDAVIHLAAETGTGQSMYEIKKYCDVNILGTSQLVDILTNKKHSIQKIIVASSRAIYGEGKYKCQNHGIVYPEARTDEAMQKGDFNCKCPICNSDIDLMATSEDSKIHPTSIYGITKQCQEQLVLTVGRAIGIPAVALRYQNVYGPGQSLKNPYTGILSIFSTQIKNNNNINIFEDGKESRDFVYIDDVVNSTILGLENKVASNIAINIGSGHSINVQTIAEILKRKYNSNVEINISGNFRLGDIRHNFADIAKAKDVLAFVPRWDFHKGIINFCEWVDNSAIEMDMHSISMNALKVKGLLK